MPHRTTHRRGAFKTAYRPELTTIFLCIIAIVILPSAFCCADFGDSDYRDDTATQEAVPVAVGINLGQSYVTSVARLSNGTVISLAKVPATDEYMAFMERMIQQPASRDRPGLLQNLWGLVMRVLGLPRSRDVAILAEMTAALKTESEAALGGRAIESAAVTAPCMAAWDDQRPSNSIIHDVLVQVGIDPVSWEAGHPNYLGEINTLLAANERWLCPKYWCSLVDPDPVDWDPRGRWSVDFVISFTNQSLYTSSQYDTCFFIPSWDNYLGTIDPRFGLDKLTEWERPQDFWHSVRQHLLDQVTERARMDLLDTGIPITVLVAGEGANEPDFIRTIQEFVEGIPNVRATIYSEMYGRARPEYKGKMPEVELVVPDDPTFAAARGAAFWMWTRVAPEGTYCSEAWCATHPGYCKPHYNIIPHDEL